MWSWPQFRQSTEGFELFEGAATALAGGGGHREEIPNVEEDFEGELIANVVAVEIGHSIGVLGGLGAVEGLAVDGFQVTEDVVARAHGVSGLRGGLGLGKHKLGTRRSALGARHSALG